MKITLNWLKQYVDFSWSPEELTERLTMLGLEVEAVVPIAGEFEGVVVAEIRTSEKHPNADKLSVCRVWDGKGERQIVCGATNFKTGDKVPLALPGCTLPSSPGEAPFTIKVGKLRGVESQGMMCSASELRLAGDAEGLLILPSTATVGQPLAEHLGRSSGDVVYDLEITPNRPDLNSVIGIAREISAWTGNPLKIPSIEWPAESEAAEPVEKSVAVFLPDPDLCPRYVARIIRGAKVGPSPDWLRNILEKVGIRSISNVVDVTNYVMLETGQPLHAFDYHLVGLQDGKATIHVRRAKAGESLTTLDGQKRSLTPEMLLIADAQKGIALAGIMGGQNSEIQEATCDILIESACFKPQNIRATSKKLDLRTDSSYRFERGADVGICDWASRRAVQLILQTAGGKVSSGGLDAYPQPATPREITLRTARTDALLGISIPPEFQRESLTRLGLEAALSKPEPTEITFKIPTWRVDLKQEVDLIEEVNRLYGVEKIPSSTPRGAVGFHSFDAIYDALAEARLLMTSLGLTEAQGQTLIAENAARLVSENSIALQNPLSSEMNFLRPSLLPGLLDSLRHNASHKNEDVSLFEMGRVFLPGQTPPREERRIAVAMMGRRSPESWNAPADKFDIYDLKGALEEFLEQFGVKGINWVRQEERSPLFVEVASLILGKQVLGMAGQVLPPLAKQYDLRGAVFMAELNIDLLLSRRSPIRSYKALPVFPAIRRDVAMVVPEGVSHEAVVQAIRQVKPANLESIALFDVFRGNSVPEGQKSVAYALTYRSPEKTLTDTEVNAAQEKVVNHLKQTFQASIR